MGEELETLSEWFKANKLSPNINKTNSVYFTRQNIAHQRHILEIKDVSIEKVDALKFVVIPIDQN